MNMNIMLNYRIITCAECLVPYSVAATYRDYEGWIQLLLSASSLLYRRE